MEEYYAINHKIDELWDRRSANSHSPTNIRRINDDISDNAIKIITLWSQKNVSPRHREEFFSLMLDRLVTMLTKEHGTHPGAINVFSKVLSASMKMCHRRVLGNAQNANSTYVEFSNQDADMEVAIEKRPNSMVFDDPFPIEERIIAREVMLKARRGEYRFSPREQQVFESVYADDFISVEQTARDLGVHRNTVSTLLSRLISKIKKAEGFE